MNDFFYKKVDAYHIAKEYVLYVYSLLKNYPQYENHALCDQIRRSIVSVPSNLAEGSGRISIKEQLHFYEISYGSLMESYCQLILASDLNYIGTADLDRLRPQIDTVARMLNGLRSSLLKTVNSKP